MSSEVEICNLALSHIKAGTINSMVNTSSEAARKCALYFGPARDAVLRDHQWNFAQKIRSLAPFTMPEGYGNRFRYAYMYPVDALKVHRVYAANSSTKSEFDVKRAPTNEKIILTNAMQAWTEYTMRVTDATWFDPEFVEAMSYALAAKLAMPLTTNANLAQDMSQRYYIALSQAKTNDASEGNPEEVERMPWVEARFGRPMGCCGPDFPWRYK